MNAWRDIDAHELQQLLADGRPLSLLDVREASELASGMLPGALHIPLGQLAERRGELQPGRWLVYCAAGVRSQAGAQLIEPLGEVMSLRGGIEAWREQGGALQGERDLDASQRERYSRHLLLPELGYAGQQALLASSVLVVGAGGLGSPAALYLAAAGVGTIGLVDDDVVELSNLQRQVLHSSQRVGQPKTASAALALRGLNPQLQLVEHQVRLRPDNVLELLAPYDLIVNGADNFPTRYLLSDAAFRAGKPVVDGSVLGFSGQLTVLAPHLGGPCYRCLYPQAPPAHLAPSCSQAGVLGAVTGVIGTMQAVEAVKLLAGIGEPLVGRLGLYDGLDASWQRLKVARDPSCPVCSQPPEAVPEQFPDYVAFCAA